VEIPRDVVAGIAALARLRFTEEEAARLRLELSGILGYFGEISEVRTEGVVPTSHPVPVSGALRDDVARRDPGVAADLLALGPDAAAPFFRVPSFHGAGDADPPEGSK
jgi:aspartyl-tRNA(Asn)/glutamyl-tRNA(Gln) amidotransferase subunit C